MNRKSKRTNDTGRDALQNTGTLSSYVITTAFVITYMHTKERRRACFLEHQLSTILSFQLLEMFYFQFIIVL